MCALFSRSRAAGAACTPPLRAPLLHRPPQPLYLCLEPVTHVADAFNLAAQGQADTGTVLLAPGESFSASLTISLRARSMTAGE